MRYFKRLRSVNKSYEEQGLIYFTCINYKRQPARIREKIDRLCESAGGEYATALKEYMTTDADWIYICDRYHLSNSTLERIRRAFFESW